MLIERIHYNHGITQYKFERKFNDYRIFSVGSKTISFIYYKDEITYEVVFINHFKKDDFINSNMNVVMKFDKESISIYTLPRSLTKQVFNQENEVFIEDQFFIQDLFSNKVLTSNKLTKKSIKIQKIELIECEVKSSTRRTPRKIV